MRKFEISPPDPEKVQTILSLARLIEAALNTQENCEDLLTQMSDIIQCADYDADYFRRLHTHSSLEDFAAQAAYPAAKRIPGICREDLIEIMQLAKAAVVDPGLDYYLALFDANVDMPGASNILFHPPEDWPYLDSVNGAQNVKDYDPSAGEIVDYVLGYKVITL